MPNTYGRKHKHGRTSKLFDSCQTVWAPISIIQRIYLFRYLHLQSYRCDFMSWARSYNDQPRWLTTWADSPTRRWAIRFEYERKRPLYRFWEQDGGYADSWQREWWWEMRVIGGLHWWVRRASPLLFRGRISWDWGRYLDWMVLRNRLDWRDD